MALSVGTGGIDWRSATNLASERVRRQVSAKIKRYAKTLVQELQRNTPVLTGQARASWLVSIGSPPGLMYGPSGLTGSTADLAHGLPSRVDLGGSTAYSDGIIERWELGSTLYIYNNLPYIQRLNAGYSGQAPAGFVESAIMRASASIKG